MENKKTQIQKGIISLIIKGYKSNYLKKICVLTIYILIVTCSTRSYSQEIPKTQTLAEIKGYIGIVNPIYTFSKSGNTPNFKDAYTVGLPCGVNFWKSKKIAISLEFTPFIKSTDNSTALSYFLFHPGILYRLGKGFTVVGRLAFQTNGRYGFTPMINKILIQGKDCNFYVSILLPIRVGNNEAISLGTGIMFGIGF